MKSLTLTERVKQKKEFSSISHEIVGSALNKILKKFSKRESFSEKEIKLIVKEVRSELRKISGLYQKSSKNREKLLAEGKIQELLQTHYSTAERVSFYPKLNKILSSLKVNSVLDIGCGLNPIVLASSKIKYNACDIRDDELSLIRKFFSQNNIQGNVFICDAADFNRQYPAADLCLVLKLLDIVEKRAEVTRHLLTTVKCRYFIISFSTRKISGKKMNHPKRIWFEKILSRLNLNYLAFQSDNEIFYLITQESLKTTLLPQTQEML